MFIVTNTIQVETDRSEKIIQQFTKGHTKESMNAVEGFLNFQLMQRLLPEDETITELVVLSQWVSKEHQKNWVNSNSFKEMHARKKPKEEIPKEQKRPGIISNKIAEYDVLT